MDEKNLQDQREERTPEEQAIENASLFERPVPPEDAVIIDEPAAPEAQEETVIDPPRPPEGGTEGDADQAGEVLTFEEETPANDSGDGEEPPDSEEKKSHKKVWIGIGVGIGIILAIYLGLSFYFSTRFYFNTTMNGFNVTGKTAAQVDQEMQQNAATHTLTLKERGGKTETIAADQVNMRYISDGKISQMLNDQNAFAWPMSLVPSGHQDLEATFSYDDAQLTNALNQLQAVSGAEVVKVANAYPKFNGTSYAIEPEVTGNELDPAKLKDAVKNAILSGDTELDLEAAGCYKKPSFTKDSAKVKEATDTMNKYLNATVTYTFGDATEVLDKNTINTWLAVDGNMDVQFNQDLMTTYVANLSDKYDTYGITRSFQTSGGGSVSIAGGDYGWLIDQDEEVAALIPIIQAGQPVTREPVYAQTAASHSSPDYGNTYVEISLGGQYMWFYKNGGLVVGTPVVTGSLSGGFATPSGVYGLDYKAMNVTLKGEGYASPVTFWMPYAGDIGIHDASWRTDFGGNIYVNSGSHGCVNTPYAAAQAIYNGIEDGTPVIVY